MKEVQIQPHESFTASAHEAVLHVALDTLHPYLRNYAMHLRKQIFNLFEQHGVNDYASFKNLSLEQPSKVSRATIGRLNILLSRLDDLVKGKEVGPELTRHQMKEDLNPLIVQWVEYLDAKLYHQDDYQKLDAVEEQTKELERWMEGRVRPLIKEFQKSQYVLQMVIKEVAKHHRMRTNPASHPRHIGIFLSAFYREAIKGAAPEEIEKITQIIDIDAFWQWKDYIGYQWPGGELHINGDVGNCLALQMNGGRIYVGRVKDFAGQLMNSGSLTVQSAGDFLGCEMEGGSIEADQALDYAGMHMRGGYISMGLARDRVGTKMKGGTVNVRECANYAGHLMKGGQIGIMKAGERLGDRMQGGRIDAMNYKSIGSPEGGEIYQGATRVFPE